MRCKSCSKQLMEYVQEDLSAARRAEMEEHLAGCSACSEQLSQLRAALGAVDAGLEIEPTAGFDDGFREKLAQARQEDARRSLETKRPRRRWFLPALATAAVAASALVVAISVTRVSPPAPGAMPSSDLEIAAHLELLQDYQAVANLDALEDFDVVMNLDSLAGGE